MGYALKIPDADFSAVAVTRIEYQRQIPCTEITLNSNAPTFTYVDDTFQLTATLTPQDTTDIVTFASSDSNVASVSENGLITIHGIGTATITATCGQQTATASVSQSEIRPKSPYTASDTYANPYGAPGSEDQILTVVTYAGQSTIGQAFNENSTDLHMLNGNTYGVQAVPVPYGATKMCFTTTDDSNVSVSYMYKLDRNTMVSTGSKSFPKLIYSGTFVGVKTGLTVEYGEAVVVRPTDTQKAKLNYMYFK